MVQRGDITIIGNQLGHRATNPAQRRRFRAFFETCFTGDDTFRHTFYTFGLDYSDYGSVDRGIVQDALIERSISKARFKMEAMTVDLDEDDKDGKDDRRDSTTDSDTTDCTRDRRRPNAKRHDRAVSHWQVQGTRYQGQRRGIHLHSQNCRTLRPRDQVADAID